MAQEHSLALASMREEANQAQQRALAADAKLRGLQRRVDAAGMGVSTPGSIAGPRTPSGSVDDPAGSPALRPVDSASPAVSGRSATSSGEGISMAQRAAAAAEASRAKAELLAYRQAAP